ncbi:hypothetical protein N182_24780 [Sinorhizobium sp. GL2]|nr:hypothetical protein N182_24780 [Sinorhizobium sp. GL2]
MTDLITTDAQRVNWAERRSMTLGRIADLKEQRGAALVDGTKFDSQAIRDAEDELDAIDAAEAAEERQTRQRLLDEDEQRRRRAQGELAKVRKSRESAIQQAEDACHALASALGRIISTSGEASVLMMKLGFPAPLSLNRDNVKLSASFRLAMILYGACGPKFGLIKLPEIKGNHLPDGSRSADSWRIADQKKTSAAFEAALDTGERK